MYPCLAEVRRTIAATVKELFKGIPSLRVGIIAHGDYCDAPPRGKYVVKMLDLTSSQNEVIRFVNEVEPTGGGDAPECYELVLAEARRFSWAAGKNKALVMIGDDVPHGPTYPGNTRKLDWRNELDLLQESRIAVYGVQALNRSHATAFWAEVAKKTGGLSPEAQPVPSRRRSAQGGLLQAGVARSADRIPRSRSARRAHEP